MADLIECAGCGRRVVPTALKAVAGRGYCPACLPEAKRAEAARVLEARRAKEQKRAEERDAAERAREEELKRRVEEVEARRTVESRPAPATPAAPAASPAPAKFDADGKPLCPECGSNAVHVDKRGFSAKKAGWGLLLLGPVGLAAGALKSQKLRATCLNCHHEWEP